MQDATEVLTELAREHRALMREYGLVQMRCSAQMQAQAREIDTLQALALRLRAQLVVQASEQAWLPGKTRTAQPARVLARPDDAQALERSLRAADLVICQTGCLSHGAYWRVRDHCKRTGKTCVMVEEPDALCIVRIHKTTDAGEGGTRIAAEFKTDA